MTEPAEVLIVGAGISGLVAAASLRQHHAVRLIEKSRGVGGRMATRRIGDATFDHGAQFFTTHTREFAEFVSAWVEADFATPWFNGRLGHTGELQNDAHTRYRGTVSMNDVAKNLAAGLQAPGLQEAGGQIPDVQIVCSTRATSLETTDSGWLLRTDTGQSYLADAVFLTSPVPQSLELLDAGGVQLAAADRHALERIRYDPCIAVMATLSGPSGLGAPGAINPASGPIDWIADNAMKGISAAVGVTIHATAEFSKQNLDAPDSVVIAALIRAAELASAPIPELCQVQRWRYAKPMVVHPEPYLLLDAHLPLVCVGDCFGGAKVEGAVLSGAAGASAVQQLLQAR